MHIQPHLTNITADVHMHVFLINAILVNLLAALPQIVNAFPCVIEQIPRSGMAHQEMHGQRS